ncbi:hypothetical protein [Ralstonia phage RSP15]|uniref:hypothetical protein n=1 Tax=Ralstonia phage RSP15 TaxID=1785960 RepID=UPI00074D298D|nr:hypothetical protein BH754_gp174 [Ralstonia phage RSP15]BAU40132.1 hypothetical protein [Ralstonia phage RSP15]
MEESIYDVLNATKEDKPPALILTPEQSKEFEMELPNLVKNGYVHFVVQQYGYFTLWGTRIVQCAYL